MLVERGHLSHEEIDIVRAEFDTQQTAAGATPNGRWSLIETLIAMSLVDRGVVDELKRAIDFQSPPGSDWRAGFPIEGMERFEILRLQGSGGMGEVYKARDRELNRVVAIKVLHGGDPGMRRRFATEARAQAKISHPNVCEIYDVGEANGRQFIVMQFIDGESLKEAAGSMPLERRVRLVRDVAMAVHCAHREGLIHRDLKPGNVMVATGDDGLPTPYVVDFGIARDAAEPGMTVSGDLLGSPAFMAPEQARGALYVDRRTDVYGLGATLYSVLTGQVPFRGETAFDTLMKVQLDEPEPPRNLDPSIPLDLDSIVLKALDKEPRHRYQSAKELADDLDRFLDGRPVIARPIGPGRRLVKWVARHRTLAASLAVLLLSVVTAVGYGLAAAAEARQRQRLTLLFGTEAQRLDAMMRVAHLLPLHDTTPDRERIRGRMDWIREQQRDVRGEARAPGWYALGRGHLVLGELAPARELLGKAWDAGFRSPDVAYAYGLTLGMIYRNEAARLGEIRDPELREARRGEIQRTYRDPAVELLEAATDVEGQEPTYVAGLLALFEGEHEQAIELARKTTAAAPFRYEAWQLQGEAAVMMVQQSAGRGDQAAAEAFTAIAEEGFTEAVRLARSDPDAYSGLCTLWGMVMGMRLYGGGGDIATPLAEAVAACDQALVADPGRTEERRNKAICYRQMAELAIRTGEDPGDWLERARTSIREVLEIDPNDAGAYIDLSDSYSIGVVWWTGLDRADRSVPPATVLEWSGLSVANARSAVQIDPESVGAHRALGTASMMRTELLVEAGLDPRESMAAAEAAFTRASELDPDALFVINNHAWALYQRGKYELLSGGDPDQALRACQRIAERAVAIKHNHVTALNALGQARLLQARFLQSGGHDPTAVLDGARTTFEDILKINPEWAIGRAGLFSVLAVRADHVASSGGDASDLIGQGLATGAELYALPTVAKDVRWDYANLLAIAANDASEPAARRRLARQAAELYDQVTPAERLPQWHDRRELARRLSGR
ncbi:MAG TPA: protein kinase [Methylomirabilota bacterium]|nr:protein kinase [Methylomirabilota bacterium]